MRGGDGGGDERALADTHRWFEVNSGWAPPDPDTLADWLADGVCRCPDECLVEPEGTCAHGLASWKVVLDALAADDALAAASSRQEKGR